MTITGASDVDQAAALSTQALRDVAHLDWSVPAAGLEWSCYDTAVHMASDLVGYAGQLTGRATADYVPFEITAEPGTTPAGLIRVIEATGGLLSAAVRTSGPDVRAWHPCGMAGADGFAAMGVVEALLHTHDVLTGLGVHGWQPPADLCRRVLDRLFPQAPATGDPWTVLRWMTGRAELPGLPRLTAWRWYADPVRAEGMTLCEISPAVAADLHRGGPGGFAWAADGPAEGTRFAAGMVVKAHEDGSYRPGWGTYAMVRATDQLAVGGIGFHAAPDADGTVEIGYDVVPSARGNGHATQALRALSAWALARPGVSRVTATVEPDNAPSHAVVARAGFTRTGTAEGGTRYARTAA
ncbi:GNAT family N-acetyltransferase [Streptomyces sp. NPDC002990]